MFSESKASSKQEKKGNLQTHNGFLCPFLQCCNNPYLAGVPITNDHPSHEAGLQVGIAASGKLRQLDNLLQELKRGGGRVVVLTQHKTLLAHQGWFVKTVRWV